MALTRFLFSTCLVLLSLLLIEVSADYGYGPKPPQVEQPKPPQVQKPEPPQVEKPKLDQLYGELLPHKLFGIQGIILCNSGLKPFPIQGAVARITCVGEDENGYETAPFSMLTAATDAKGYFFTTLSPSKLQGNYNKKWKLTECKTFLDNSPLESCKVPTDVNHGISGAPLASYRKLNVKAENMKLFSVGPFYYAPTPKPTPNGY
ncbi:protein SEED AND ROOT HAIR PROTECTIVE PROTEIN-like [Argentina anserina]|uniref:protein SEED AND ROOT HAIR PROTECTIVE PROTEIN-like n=1 Tax=Argentina anserina TaxID=57926 RepID=UPI0021763CDC|nr:protein SEED AND ROOT HAIR PROTECTIVE PROTEIN-like [Potentilla anserina]